MPRINVGGIDYIVDCSISDEQLNKVAHAGRVVLDASAREKLRHIAFACIERRQMSRPDYARVKKQLERLRRFATRAKVEQFCDEFIACAAASR